jgi:hypothetical protein
MKLWSLGWRPAGPRERGELPPLRPDQISAEACEMEHCRWAADMLLAGWRRGSRNETELTHPDLRPYADFPQDELASAVQKDRDPWLDAPRIAALMHPRLFVREAR